MLDKAIAWLKRLFRPKPQGWCDRCQCVHTLLDRDFEKELAQKMAKQIQEEIDREILAEMADFANCDECYRAKEVGAVCSRHGDPWKC